VNHLRNLLQPSGPRQKPASFPLHRILTPKGPDAPVCVVVASEARRRVMADAGRPLAAHQGRLRPNPRVQSETNRSPGGRKQAAKNTGKQYCTYSFLCVSYTLLVRLTEDGVSLSRRFLLVLLLGIVPSALAQNGSADDSYFGTWFERVSRTQAEQPHWITPMFTTTPRLEEEVRYDIGWQNTAKGDVTNFGSGKGLEFIPSEHTEIIVSPPPYFSHQNPTLRDGFGDTSFLLKYRFAASNEEAGNYIVTAFLGGSIPTGSYSNGAENAVVTPSIALGKGWGAFDVQSTLGIAVPVGDISRLGTSLAYNTAVQYHLLRKLWPELEVNGNLFYDGKNDGKQQVFLSPGLVVGKIHLWRRLGLTVGAGEQIALTRFHTFNHNRVLSVRFPF
jgi:Putative MetA-pathway of phenol degradation